MAMRKIGWLTLVLVLAFSSFAAAQVNMEFKGADVRDVLHVLGQLGGFNVVLDQGVQGEVTLQLKDIPVDEAIELVVKVSGYSSQWVGTNTLVVASMDQLASRFAIKSTQVYPVKHVSPASLIPALQALLDSASVVADPVGQSIIVRGTEEQLKFAGSFIKERDVAPPLQIDVTRGSVVELFRTLAKAGGYTLVADPRVQGELTFYYRGTDVQEAIKLVSEQSGVAYTISGKQLILQAPRSVATTTTEDSSAAPVASTVPRTEMRIYRLQHVAPAQVRSVVGALVGESNVKSDEVNRTLIVTASAEELTQVAGLIAAYDVPELRVRGVVVQNDNRVVILEVNDETHVLAEGSRIAGYTVESVAFDQVILIAPNGEQRMLSNWKGAK